MSYCSKSNSKLLGNFYKRWHGNRRGLHGILLLASGLDSSSSPKDLLLEKSSLNKTETDFQYTYIEKFIHFINVFIILKLVMKCTLNVLQYKEIKVMRAPEWNLFWIVLVQIFSFDSINVTSCQDSLNS